MIVHRLEGEAYALHGRFVPGEAVDLVLPNGLTVDVTLLFAVADDVAE